MDTEDYVALGAGIRLSIAVHKLLRSRAARRALKVAAVFDGELADVLADVTVADRQMREARDRRAKSPRLI